MRGICTDTRWSGGTPSAKIASLYWRQRPVLFADQVQTIENLINSGIYVHGVIASESGDPAQFAAWGFPNFDVTVGNEPDIQSPSSWTLSPSEYGQLWQATSNYAAPRWIGGFASGDVSRAGEYLPYAPNAAGIDVHLYTLSPDDANARIAEYQSLGLPVRVGEWHPADGYKLTDYSFSVDANDFCVSDQMVGGMGLYV